MMLKILRRIDQQIRHVAGKLRFLACSTNGAVHNAIDNAERIGKAIANGYGLDGSMVHANLEDSRDYNEDSSMQILLNLLEEENEDGSQGVEGKEK